jgi:RND family efflux transporter MFP subunit
MQKYLSFVKKHKIITGLLVVVLIGGYFWYAKAHATKAKAQYLTAPAAKTTITVSINGTGQVSSENKIDLKPGSSGALTSVNVKQGDMVSAGEVIAVVDEKNNNVALMQAQAGVASAQANYDKLTAGLSGTDLATAQLSVTTAQQALDKAKRDYDNTVLTQQQAVDKAYSNLLNGGLSADASDNVTTATITLSGSYTGKNQGQYIISLYQAGDGLHYQVTGLGNTTDLVQRGLLQQLGNGLYITFSTTGIFSPNTTWTINVPNLKSSSYLADSFAYSQAQQSQTLALASAQDSINSAQNSLTSAQLQLQSKTAPATNADLSAARAQIAQAQAALLNAETNYGNNIIKAPFDGQVAQLNNQKGDQVTSSTVVATVITPQKLAVISLNEVDASKAKVGQKANLTFDAINGLNVTGHVAQIDTIGVVSQGVVTYSVKIGPDSQDDRIKPGMSVSASIITDVQTDVLSVPSSAVKSDTSGNYVQELDSAGNPVNKTVQIGISNDTDTQIVGGLNDGENVITQTITASSTTAASSNRTSIPGLGGGAGGGGGRFRGGG